MAEKCETCKSRGFFVFDGTEVRCWNCDNFKGFSKDV